MLKILGKIPLIAAWALICWLVFVWARPIETLYATPEATAAPATVSKITYVEAAPVLPPGWEVNPDAPSILKQLLRNTSAEDFPRVWTEANILFHYDSRHPQFMATVLEAWAEKDIDSAFEKFCALDNEDDNLSYPVMMHFRHSLAVDHPIEATNWLFENINNVSEVSDVLAYALIKYNLSMFSYELIANKHLVNPSQQSDYLKTTTIHDYNSIDEILPILALFDNLEIVSKFHEIDIAAGIARKLYQVDEVKAIDWIHNLSDEDVKVGAVSGILKYMDSNKLIMIYHKAKSWNLSTSALHEVTANILYFLASQDYTTMKDFYLTSKDVPEIKANLERLTSNIKFNRLSTEIATKEILFWLNEISDIKTKDDFARSMQGRLSSSRADYEQIKALVSPYILEEFDADAVIYMELPPPEFFATP